MRLKIKDGAAAAALVGVIIIVALAVTLGPFITMFCWWAVIPDVFSGAVEQGLLPESITWWQAFKIALFMGMALGLSRGGSSS